MTCTFRRAPVTVQFPRRFAYDLSTSWVYKISTSITVSFMFQYFIRHTFWFYGASYLTALIYFSLYIVKKYSPLCYYCLNDWCSAELIISICPQYNINWDVYIPPVTLLFCPTWDSLGPRADNLRRKKTPMNGKSRFCQNHFEYYWITASINIIGNFINRCSIGLNNLFVNGRCVLNKNWAIYFVSNTTE